LPSTRGPGRQRQGLRFPPHPVYLARGELERRIASLERKNALLKRALQRKNLMGDKPIRGYAAETPATNMIVPANQLGTKRVALQAGPKCRDPRAQEPPLQVKPRPWLALKSGHKCPPVRWIG